MKTQSSVPPSESPVDGIVNRLWNVEQGVALSALDLYAAWLGNIAKAQSELLRFAAERFSKNAQVLAQFAGCRTPADVSRLQVSLGTGMLADYLAETQRLVGMFAAGSTDKSAVA